GLYWFLRIEGLSRPSAATGGVVLALAISGSQLALSLPFAATLAWTAVVLACAARALRAAAWSGRLLWIGVAAVAWGQLAAAHLSIGLLMGTLAVAVYLGAAGWRFVRDGRLSTRQVGAIVAVLIPCLALINLAFL